MEKEVEGKWVLFTKHTLNSPMEIGQHASKDEPMLRELAAKNGLKVSGPLEHAYWNMAIEGVPHLMEIWLPIQVQGTEPKNIGLKLVEPYKCLSSDFKRHIEEIGDSWMELGEVAKKHGFQLTNHDREVYRNMDCDNPDNNDIELQLGIK